VVATATTRYCRGVKPNPKHIPVVIFVRCRVVSLMLERSSLFPREEIHCITGLCRGHGNRSFRLRVVSPTLNSPTCKVDSPTCLMYVIGQFAYGSYVQVVDVDLSCYHNCSQHFCF